MKYDLLPPFSLELYSQWFVRWAVWDRFVQDRVWQFVDLLSVTNISCLLLQEQTYGYYLHGRSVHDHVDTDMLHVRKSSHLPRQTSGKAAWCLFANCDVGAFLSDECR